MPRNCKMLIWGYLISEKFEILTVFFFHLTAQALPLLHAASLRVIFSVLCLLLLKPYFSRGILDQIFMAVCVCVPSSTDS